MVQKKAILDKLAGEYLGTDPGDYSSNVSHNQTSSLPILVAAQDARSENSFTDLKRNFSQSSKLLLSKRRQQKEYETTQL